MAKSTSCARRSTTSSGGGRPVRSSSMSSEPARAPDPPTVADPDVMIGYPVSRTEVNPLALGPGARLRSGTVLYDGTTIGRCLQTGHGVVVREACKIGHDVSIWSNSVVDY